MADAHRVETWSHTAALWSLQANINRDPKKRSLPFTFRDLCPWLPKPPKPKPDKENVQMLRGLLPAGFRTRRIKVSDARKCLSDQSR